MTNIIHVIEPLGYSKFALSLYSKIGEVVLGDDIDEDDYVSVFCIVIRLRERIDDDFIKSYPNLKWVISPTTGITHIDTFILRDRKIKLLTLRECRKEIASITSTPELTLGLIISLIRNIHSSFESVKKGEWHRDRFSGRQLSSLNVGVVGLGRVGSKLSTYLVPLFKRVYGYDKSDLEHSVAPSDVELLNSTLDVCKKSDVIVLTASYDYGDPPIIGSDLFESGVLLGKYLINTSRGEIVDEVAIKESLERKELLGYATDVLVNESELSKSPIMSCINDYNVLVTPHIGGCSIDAMRQTEEIVAEKFMRLV